MTIKPYQRIIKAKKEKAARGGKPKETPEEVKERKRKEKEKAKVLKNWAWLKQTIAERKKETEARRDLLAGRDTGVISVNWGQEADEKFEKTCQAYHPFSLTDQERGQQFVKAFCAGKGYI